MEVKELVSFYINETSETLDVTFRLLFDKEDEIRTDQIDLDETIGFGFDFDLKNKINDAFGDDFEDEFSDGFDYSDEYDIDDDEVISFLNEYYLVNPKKLPKSELF
jgi:hypothetical protein